jgi:hypothetical protein
MPNTNPNCDGFTAAMAAAKCASIRWALAAIYIYACHASPMQTCSGFNAPRRLPGLRTGHKLVGSLLKWPSISTVSHSMQKRRCGRGLSTIIKTATATAMRGSVALEASLLLDLGLRT